MTGTKRKIVLGINNSSHDTSAAIISDGLILAFSSQERFDRKKHSGEFPTNAIDFCLTEAQITDINEIGEISFGFNWKQRVIDRFDILSRGATEEQKKILLKDNELYEQRETIARKTLRDTYKYKGPIVFRDHYDCHAASVFFSSSFDESAILVLDGAGERASARIYYAHDLDLKVLLQIDFPNSLGRFYSAITEHLGFHYYTDAGKVMGLAPYGTPDLQNLMKKVLRVNSDNTYNFERSFLDLYSDNRKGFSNEFRDIFGPKREAKALITQHHKDIAWAAQNAVEEAMLAMAKKASNLVASKNLCISGGVALNSVANGKIARSGFFEHLYIYPAAADDGTALGAAYLSYHKGLKKKTFIMENQSALLGYAASETDILSVLLNTHGIQYKRSDDVTKAGAQLLADNNIIGWFQGRAEIGPRALGNRSILAHPGFADNKDIVNAKIKFRESFRPFAPSVLAQYANDYFDTKGTPSPYMLLMFDVKEEKRAVIPAVTHIDGTARVQTVTKEDNPRYFKLLEHFHLLTGIPVLMDTSFNRNIEPIVNTPLDAMSAFLGSGLEYLIIGDYIVSKTY